jgi:hypothetical protein
MTARLALTLRGALAALIVAVVPAAGAQETTVARPRPDLQPVRVTGEVVLGTYAGYIGYFAGRLVGENIGDVLRMPTNGTRAALVATTGYVAGGFATAGTVYGIGSIDGQTGEFGSTLLGAGAGFVVGVAVNKLIFVPRRTAETTSERTVRRAAEFVQVLLPAIGATIGFNSTRRYTR